MSNKIDAINPQYNTRWFSHVEPLAKHTLQELQKQDARNQRCHSHQAQG
jgi:hypothetical protein